MINKIMAVFTGLMFALVAGVSFATSNNTTSMVGGSTSATSEEQVASDNMSNKDKKEDKTDGMKKDSNKK